MKIKKLLFISLLSTFAFFVYSGRQVRVLLDDPDSELDFKTEMIGKDIDPIFYKKSTDETSFTLKKKVRIIEDEDLYNEISKNDDSDFYPVLYTAEGKEESFDVIEQEEKDIFTLDKPEKKVSYKGKELKILFTGDEVSINFVKKELTKMLEGVDLKFFVEKNKYNFDDYTYDVGMFLPGFSSFTPLTDNNKIQEEMKALASNSSTNSSLYIFMSPSVGISRTYSIRDSNVNKFKLSGIFLDNYLKESINDFWLYVNDDGVVTNIDMTYATDELLKRNMADLNRLKGLLLEVLKSK